MAFGSGGYLKWGKDSQYSNTQKAQLQTVLWDTNTLALWSSNFPNVDGARGTAAARFYMGPDYSQFQDRISGNLQRAANFKTPKTSSSEYITVSRKDTKGECGKTIQGEAVGGYGWTQSGWVYYYHYITLCPSFFTLSTLDEKIAEVEEDLGKGVKTKATDMRYLRTTGQYFFHEMMHTRLVYNNQPKIIDEPVALRAKYPTALTAYGPYLVHKLASWALDDGGGANRASTNADSYAMLVNTLWWWDVTGYFPGVPGADNPTQTDIVNDAPIFLHIDLGNNTDVASTDFNSLYDAELNNYGNDAPDPNPDSNANQPAAEQDNQQCHGISGDVYILNYGIAVQNANAFCTQSQMSVQYGSGTINDMQLSIFAPHGSNKGVAESPNCVSKFVDGLINGCDGSSSNNPYNSKYGGNITTSDGWVFSFEPLAQQGVADNCNTQYEFSVDGFDTRGINFDPTKLGLSGEGLKTQIEGCSDPIIQW